MKQKMLLCIVSCWFATMICALELETVTIAILAKDKAHTLDWYLRCIEAQTWPKELTRLYIRTNNNTDNTASVLRTWVEKNRNAYAEIFFDDSDVTEQVQQYKQHEWNTVRFKVLGKIRQDSVAWAARRGSHYFVADCDNFIKPHTIEVLVRSGLPIVAPFLRCGEDTCYSNYHSHIDENGYFIGEPMYYMIFRREVTGFIQVPVVHCTYLIRNEALAGVCYDDDSYRYEYVIFSDCARKAGIPQYFDNRELYGRITMTEDREAFEREPWYAELAGYVAKN